MATFLIVRLLWWPADVQHLMTTCITSYAGPRRCAACSTATSPVRAQAPHCGQSQSAHHQMHSGSRCAPVVAAAAAAAVHTAAVLSRQQAALRLWPLLLASEVWGCCSGQAEWCAGGGIPADISLGTANGVGAAQYINRQLAVLPVLRPLVLAVKAYLRESGLNEASMLPPAVLLPPPFSAKCACFVCS